jgi:hypothetical protein
MATTRTKTKARRTIEKKVEALIPRLLGKARELAPREDFVASIQKYHYVDPEVEGWETEVIRLVVNGDRPEATEFQKAMSTAYWHMVHEEEALLHGTNLEVLTAKEDAAWPSTRLAS